jgi:hypothetical protein
VGQIADDIFNQFRNISMAFCWQQPHAFLRAAIRRRLRRRLERVLHEL